MSCIKGSNPFVSAKTNKNAPSGAFFVYSTLRLQWQPISLRLWAFFLPRFPRWRRADRHPPISPERSVGGAWQVFLNRHRSGRVAGLHAWHAIWHMGSRQAAFWFGLAFRTQNDGRLWAANAIIDCGSNFQTTCTCKAGSPLAPEPARHRPALLGQRLAVCRCRSGRTAAIPMPG